MRNSDSGLASKTRTSKWQQTSPVLTAAELTLENIFNNIIFWNIFILDGHSSRCLLVQLFDDLRV